MPQEGPMKKKVLVKKGVGGLHVSLGDGGGLGDLAWGGLRVWLNG